MRTRALVPVGFITLALLLSACSKGDSSATSSSELPTSTAPAPSNPAPTAPAPSAQKEPGSSAIDAAPEDVVEIKIGTVGEQMAYDLTSFKVKTGQRVHVVLKNNGHAAIMPHNWVLVAPGTQAAVALAGMDKKVDGYLVPGPNVLASTPLAQPQTTVETTFTAPAPGDYPFLCTVPGHYMLMKGVLSVTP